MKGQQQQQQQQRRQPKCEWFVNHSKFHVTIFRAIAERELTLQFTCTFFRKYADKIYICYILGIPQKRLFGSLWIKTREQKRNVLDFKKSTYAKEREKEQKNNIIHLPEATIEPHTVSFLVASLFLFAWRINVAAVLIRSQINSNWPDYIMS